jgi:hypothetical protein
MLLLFSMHLLVYTEESYAVYAVPWMDGNPEDARKITKF